jgi:hypothetical protein
MNILRDHAKGEIFDYAYLMDCLADYSSPRSKVTHLLRREDIIRVRKGLYVFGARDRHSMISLESVANQVFGPSYVSLEYALAFYGLIPEFVAEVTSVTTKRQKMFETPIGRFSYAHIPVALFATGFSLIQVSDYESALIATKEKALADLLYVRRIKVSTNGELEALLFEDLRLDEAGIKKFHIGVLEDIQKVGKNQTLALLIEWLRKNK